MASDYRESGLREILRALDKVSEVYERGSSAIILGLDKIFRRLVAERVYGRIILDVGAGTGVMYQYVKNVMKILSCQGGNPLYILLEPSPSFIKILRQRFHGSDDAEIIQGVAEHIPLRERSVDTSISCFMLRDVRSITRSIINMREVSRRKILILDFHKPPGVYAYIMELIYMYLIMPIILLTTVFGYVREYMLIPKSVMIQNDLRELLFVIRRLTKDWRQDLKCWFRCIIYLLEINRGI